MMVYRVNYGQWGGSIAFMVAVTTVVRAAGLEPPSTESKEAAVNRSSITGSPSHR